MSVQVFLQGKLRGFEEFLAAPAHPCELGAAGPSGEWLLAGRSHWATLLPEVLPRALLAELGLARLLLGSSGGGQFLMVLPGEARPSAEEFLGRAKSGISQLSGGTLELAWAFTENLGEWNIVRRRLAEEFERRRLESLAPDGPESIGPFPDPGPPDTGGYFTGDLAGRYRQARSAGCDPGEPARLVLEGGKHCFAIGNAADAIALARHWAPAENGVEAAPLAELAGRAAGYPAWGVLRGDVDGFAVRMRRLATVEEHIQISVMYRQFFAGELEVVCSMPEFWRKVSIVYTGGNDFGVTGAWDALLEMAREIERLFHRFADENLKDLPGPEGKTLSMAMALAPEPDAAVSAVWSEAARRLETAKSAGKDCVHVFGRTVEWKQLGHASELKDGMLRLIHEFGCSPQFLGELGGFYREREPAAGGARFERPWRYHRRFYMAAGRTAGRDFQKLRTKLITELIGRNPAQVKLRPAGRVAVAWARMMAVSVGE